MGRVEPFQRPDRDGWWIRYRDPLRGKWVKKKGGDTKTQATLKLAAIQSRVTLVDVGVITAAQYKTAEESKRPLTQILDEYKAYLQGNGKSELHIAKAVGYCRAMLIEGVRERRKRLKPPEAPVAQAECHAVPDTVTSPVRKRRGGRRGPAKPKYEWYWHRVVEPVGATTLAEIQTSDVERFLADVLKIGRSRATRNEYLGAANWLLNWAAERHKVGVNPLKIIPTLNAEEDARRKSRALTAEELKALLDGVEDRERKLFYRVAAQSGLRRGEIAALTWGRLDLADGWFVLNAADTKSGRGDELPMGEELRRELVAFRPAEAKPTDRVFATTPTLVTFKRDLKRAGIVIRTVHGQADFKALRMTFCTHVALVEPDVRVAQRLMRHTDPKLTIKRYTDPHLIDMRTALNNLPTGEPASAAKQAAELQEKIAELQAELSRVKEAAKSGATGGPNQAGNLSMSGGESRTA